MLQMVKQRINPLMVLGEAQTYDELAEILQARRQELGLTQMQLGHEAEFHDGYVGKLEAGSQDQEPGASVRRAGRVTLYRWLKALQVKLVIVVADEEDDA